MLPSSACGLFQCVCESSRGDGWGRDKSWRGCAGHWGQSLLRWGHRAVTPLVLPRQRVGGPPLPCQWHVGLAGGRTTLRAAVWGLGSLCGSRPLPPSAPWALLL